MNRIHVLVVFLIVLLRCALVPASAERDLETGTFLTRDPAGFVDGPNLYNYVGQNPWSRFDPDGLAQEFLDGTKVSYNQQSGYYVVERGSSIGPGPVNHAAANWMLNRGSSNPAVVDRHLRSIQKYDPYTIGAAMGDPIAQALFMGGGLPGGVGHDSNGKTISPRQAGVRRYSGGWRNTDTKPEGSAKSQSGVSAYEVDTYGNLNKRALPKDGLQHDHQPSHGALVEQFKLQYGRAPTDAEAAQLRNQGVAVAVPDAKHREASPTYGGRNTLQQRQADARDTKAAVERDSRAMAEAADPQHRSAAERAAEQVKERNGK